MPSGAIRIGTSGWSYPHWRSRFYPRGLRERVWLSYYQQQFSTVEINNTFYRLPSAKAVAAWRDAASPQFCYAVKGSRFITHVRRLRDCEAPVRRLLDRLEPLHSRLAVMLWQLPEAFERDDDALEQFLRILPAQPRHAFEFRHSSWWDEAIYRLLGRHNSAFVCASSQARGTTMATTHFVYIRFHGLEHNYAYEYTDADLKPWAEWLREQAATGRHGYVFFNNDGAARAPENARRLAQLIGDAAHEWPCTNLGRR